MTVETIINVGIGVAVAGTVITLTGTIAHAWRRDRRLRRDAKLPQTGSRKPGLDPDRPPLSLGENVEQPDADQLMPSLDPDRPPPPAQEEADRPDVSEGVVRNG